MKIALFILQWIIFLPLAWMLRGGSIALFWLAFQCSKRRGKFKTDKLPEFERAGVSKIRTGAASTGQNDDKPDELTVKAVMTLWGMTIKDARAAVVRAGNGTTQDVIAKIARE